MDNAKEKELSILKKSITLENLVNHVDELVMVFYGLHTTLIFDEECLAAKDQHSAKEFQEDYPPEISEEDSEILTNLNQAIEDLEEFSRETMKYAYSEPTKDLDITTINTQPHTLLHYYLHLVESALKTIKSIIGTKFSHPATIETVSNIKSIVEKITEN